VFLTPTNASWANPIEAQFGPLRQFTMANSDHPNHPALARELHAYLRWRNANNRHPDVLAAQRRERARGPQRAPPPMGPSSIPGSMTNPVIVCGHRTSRRWPWQVHGPVVEVDAQRRGAWDSSSCIIENESRWSGSIRFEPVHSMVNWSSPIAYRDFRGLRLRP
jgi:hypothetical protein